MQAGDIELCQCTLNLLTFSISRLPALRGELLGEEIDNSAWLWDSAQDRTPVGNWKPPLCCCFFHSKVNNGWCHWRQGNWLMKLGLKTAKSVLPVLGLLTDVCGMKRRMCSAPQISLVFGRDSWWCWDAVPLRATHSGDSVTLTGCHRTAAAVQHLLASGRATGADVTPINLRGCWCAKVNSPCSSDINIPLLAEWEGLVHYSQLWEPEVLTSQSALGNDFTTWPCPRCSAFIFPPVEMDLWTLRDSPLQDCLLTCKAVIFPIWLASWSGVGCWM